MEKIKIKGSNKLYEIRSIQTISPHVLQIVFNSTPPTKWGDITLYTAGDIECATLTGWETVYRDEGKTIYLSDDGSTYKAPDPDTGGEVLPPEPYEPTLDELKLAKKREISQACEQTIYSGVDVALTDGSTEHFSLTERDQLNLFGKQAELSAGATRLRYHTDGQPCRYYDAADMQLIVSAAMEYVSYHTTYCKSLYMWINGAESAEEIQQIYYGAEIPEKYWSEVFRDLKESAGDANESQVTE